MWVNLILEIRAKCTGDTDEWAVGTGFPVDRGRVLTARHVVHEGSERRTEICARWASFGNKHDFEAEVHAAFPDHGFLPAEVLWEDETLDVVLLDVCHPMKAGVLLLSSYEPAMTMDRATRGFPDGAKIGGAPEGITINGKACARPKCDLHIQFDPDNPPQNLDEWGGVSGAPLVDEETGVAKGVLVEARKALGAARSLNVVPAAVILKAPGFRAHLADWRSHQPRPEFHTQFKACLLDRLTEALRRLGEVERKDLVRCGLGDAVEGLEPEALAKQLLAEDQIEQGLSQLVKEQPGRLRSGDKDCVERFGRICQILFLGTLQEEALRLVSYFQHNRQEQTADPLAGFASTVMLLEALAAAIDGQSPEYKQVVRSARHEEPVGRRMMPFALPETGGHEEDPAARYSRDLAVKLGFEAINSGDLERSVEDYMRSQEVIYPETISDRDRDWEMTAREISTRLAEAKDDGERSYFIPAVSTGDPARDDKLRERLQILRQKIPELLILGFIPDQIRADEERRRHSKLIRTVPVAHSED